MTAGPCVSSPSNRQVQTSCLVGLGRSPVSHGHPRPNAAGYANRVLFLADGHIADEIAEPTAGRPRRT